MGASGAIALTLLLATLGGKLPAPPERPPPAERLALVERPRRRAALAPERAVERALSLSRPTAGAGLGERSKAVSEALGTVARAWARGQAVELEDDRVSAGNAPPQGPGRPRGRSARGGLIEAAGLGWRGYRESLEQAAR